MLLMPALLAFLILLPSCYTTRELEIQVLHPPKKIFFNTPRDIVLLNRMPVVERWNDTLLFHDLKIPVKMYNDLSWKALYGFTDVASDSPWTDRILFDSLLLDSVGTENLPEPLDTEVWLDHLARNNATTCVDLATLLFHDSISRKEEYMMLEENEATENWITILDVWLTVRSVWYLYDLEDTSLLDRAVLEDTIRLSSAGFSYRDALSRLPSLKMAIHDLSRMAGIHYAYRIFPVWDPVTRIYYAGGNPALKKAARYAQENKWLAAAEIWRRLAYTAGPKVAAKAAFNMALASEINDKLDLAEEWLNRSLQLEDSKVTRNYLGIIRERKKEYRKMNLNTSGD